MPKQVTFLEKSIWSYEFKKCRSRISLRSETIMQSSNLSFLIWYNTMFLMTVTNKGFSRKEIQKHLGLKRYEPVWGNSLQLCLFLYFDECFEAVFRLMKSDFKEPFNIPFEEVVTINQVSEIAISDKNITIKNIDGQEFIDKYGFKCLTGVPGRNADNRLYEEKIGWKVSQPLRDGIVKTFS